MGRRGVSRRSVRDCMKCVQACGTLPPPRLMRTASPARIAALLAPLLAACATPSASTGGSVHYAEAGPRPVADVPHDARQELPPEVGPQVELDVAPDAPPDAAPDDVLETAPDVASDVPADAAPDVPLEPPPEPPPVPTLSPDTLAALAAELAGRLDSSAIAGHAFGGLIVDLDTDATIWAQGADTPLIPASNTKVFTTAAAISLLGEDHRMLTRAFVEGTLGSDGALDGTLHLHGEHDFTWSRWFYPDPRVPLDRLADRLWQAGLRSVAGGVEIWGAYCYEGHHFGSYEPAVHRDRARVAFLEALADRGIAVSGGAPDPADDHASMALPPGVELARWESVPLWVALWPINRKSHNEMADTLNRHVGYLIGGSSDYATGSAVILQWLAGLGVDTAGAALHDGSGLDTANRFTARQLVEVYEHMLDSPVGAAWATSLSVAGGQGPSSTDPTDSWAVVTENDHPYNGTLGWRMTGADTAGRVLGKSGTNAGITTSGVLFHRHDGRRYVFAFLMNDLPSGTYSTARAVQDQLVAGVAADLLGAGERPAAPTLTSVTGAGDGASVVARWSAVAGAEGYFVWRSADGVTWSRADRTFVTGTEHTSTGLDGGQVQHLRVSAASAAGESDPSDVYGARPGAGPAAVLIVDGDDRWQGQPMTENLRGAAHAFVAPYAAGLGAVAFDSCANEAVAAGEVALGSYDAALWVLGEESTGDETFDAAEQAAVAAFLDVGGALLVSGAEVGWDLDPASGAGATDADAAFYVGALHAAYAGDDGGAYTVTGLPGGPLAGVGELSFWTPGARFVAWPDQLEPQGGAVPALAYAGGGGIAAVSYDGDHRVVYLGFPLESVDAAEDRAALLQAVLAFFGVAAD